jgi:hypothetical protein
MSFYRCAVCNVTSKGLVAHDKHLMGKRHKRNVEKAAGPAAPKRGKPAKLAASKPESARAAKRQRQQQRDSEAVSRVRAMLQQEEDSSSMQAMLRLVPSSKPFSRELLRAVFPHTKMAEPPAPLLAQMSSAHDNNNTCSISYGSSEQYLQQQRGLVLEEVRFAIHNAVQR